MSIEDRVKVRYASVVRVASRYKVALDNEVHYKLWRGVLARLAQVVQRATKETIYSTLKHKPGFVGEATFDVEFDDGPGAMILLRLSVTDESHMGATALRYKATAEYYDLNDFRGKPYVSRPILSPIVAGPDERLLLSVCTDALQSAISQVA